MVQLACAGHNQQPVGGDPLAGAQCSLSRELVVLLHTLIQPLRECLAAGSDCFGLF